MSAEGQELGPLPGGPSQEDLGFSGLTAVSVTNLPTLTDPRGLCCVHFETKAETQVLSPYQAFGYIPGKEGLSLLLHPALLATPRYR